MQQQLEESADFGEAQFPGSSGREEVVLTEKIASKFIEVEVRPVEVLHDPLSPRQPNRKNSLFRMVPAVPQEVLPSVEDLLRKACD